MSKKDENKEDVEKKIYFVCPDHPNETGQFDTHRGLKECWECGRPLTKEVRR